MNRNPQPRRPIPVLASLLLAAVLPAAAGAHDAGAAEPGQAASAPAARATIVGLALPESAVAHADGRIFVSEIGGFGKPGDGRITIIHPDGRKQTLVDGLNDPKGLDLHDNRLVVADVDRVLRVDLDGAVTVLARPEDFPRRPVFLNDVEIDSAGVVYVSDSGDDDGAGAAVYAISADGRIQALIGAGTPIKRPNGLLNDGPGRLLVVDFAGGGLYRLAWDVSGGGQPPTVTRLNGGFGAGDGLVRDAQGRLYVSDWAGGKVWRLADPEAAPKLITEGHVSSADLALSADGRYLLMPDMKAGTLVFLPRE